MSKINSVLVKPVSADCNLSCSYCFYHNRPTDPYRSLRSHRMNDETLSILIGQLMEEGDAVSFCWQGGEPTLAGLDFFKKVVELQIKFGRDGQLVSNSLQTNGVLIDRNWARFLKRFNMLVGLSLDGPQEVHDRYRTYASGKGSFKEVMRTVDILRENEVEFNILSVVSKANVNRPEELYEFYLNEGFFYLQFIPCVEVDDSGKKIASFAITCEEWESFLRRLFNIWFNGGNPQVSIRLFENILMAYLGMEPEICEFKKRGGSYVVVEYNGDVYPCDFLVERSWFLGNLRERPLDEILESERFKRFIRLKEVEYPECKKCRFKFICNQGCSRLRMIANKLGQKESYLCAAYKNFFSYSEEKFKLLAQRIKARGLKENDT